MTRTSIFARLVLVVLAIFLPPVCGAANVLEIEGLESFQHLELSSNNRIAVVEMLQAGDEANPAFDHSALMLQEAKILFARVDVSRSENYMWIQTASANAIALKFLPPGADNPIWIGFGDVPEEPTDLVQTILESYHRLAILPDLESAISAMSMGVAEDPGKQKSGAYTGEKHQPMGDLTVQGDVEIKGMAFWTTRQATMANGILTLEPALGKMIFGTQVISLDGKTVVEGCGDKQDDGCFSVFNEADTKRKKPVVQVRVDDPRGAEAWVRYAKWQQKKNVSTKQASSSSSTIDPDALLIEITPSMMIAEESTSGVNCIADLNLQDMEKWKVKQFDLIVVEGKGASTLTCAARPGDNDLGSIGLHEEDAKAVKMTTGDRIKWRTLEVDHATIVNRETKRQDPWNMFNLSVDDDRSVPRHAVTLSSDMMEDHGLKRGNTITLRGSKRDRVQEVLIVADDNEQQYASVTTNRKLRKALGVRLDELVTLVNGKQYPTHHFQNVKQQRRTGDTAAKYKESPFGGLPETAPIIHDRLYPSSPPLVLGSHLSSASPPRNGFFGIVGLDKPVDSGRVCMYPTEKGTVRIARGDEPMPNQKPLWEAGGRERRKARWIGGFFGSIRKPETSGGDERDGQEPQVEDVAVCVRHGRLVVGRSGNGTNVVDVTYRSPRPRGWWKAYIARFSRSGRQIRDAGLKLSPDGRVTMETGDGTVMWEVDLPAAGREDVCLMA